jgi:hypothetical protein
LRRRKSSRRKRNVSLVSGILSLFCGVGLTGGGVAEEAQTSVKGMEENAIHAKYIELVCILPFTFSPYSVTTAKYSLQN